MLTCVECGQEADSHAALVYIKSNAFSIVNLKTRHIKTNQKKKKDKGVSGPSRGSLRKFVKRGQKWMVKKPGGEGDITSLALSPHAVFASSKGGRV